MNAITKTALAAVVVLGLGVSTRSAEAASYSHIDRYAVEVQKQAGDLYNEFRLHFAHAAHYRHLMSDASGLYHKAAHAHEVAHRRGSLSHLAADVASLDRLFHHLERLVDDIEHDAYSGSFGHGGHIDGDTRHVRGKLRRMEATLHHLRADIESMRRIRYRVPVYHGVHGSHGYHGGSHGVHGGITIKTGGFSFSFGH